MVENQRLEDIEDKLMLMQDIYDLLKDIHLKQLYLIGLIGELNEKLDHPLIQINYPEKNDGQTGIQLTQTLSRLAQK